MSDTDKRTDITVEQYIASLEDKQLVADTQILITLMHEISNEEPVLYGYGTIGFGVYKYQYTSGRKGEAHTLAFYPRKGKITIYLMDGTKRCSKVLSKLGKHKTTGYCIYIKRLNDIDIEVLKQILSDSFDHIHTLAQKGPIDRILWQES